MDVLFGIPDVIWGNWHQPVLLPDLDSVGKANDIEVVLRPQVLENCEESFFGLEREKRAADTAVNVLVGKNLILRCLLVFQIFLHCQFG